MEINITALPHTGEILRKYVKEKRIYQAAWARAQKVRASTVNSYFKKPTMQLETLFAICQVLNYNFIRDVADALPPELPSKTSTAQQLRIGELEKEIERLQIENALLKELAGGK